VDNLSNEYVKKAVKGLGDEILCTEDEVKCAIHGIRMALKLALDAGWVRPDTTLSADIENLLKRKEVNDDYLLDVAVETARVAIRSAASTCCKDYVVECRACAQRSWIAGLNHSWTELKKARNGNARSWDKRDELLQHPYFQAMKNTVETPNANRG
jgi:hypothetical protein